MNFIVDPSSICRDWADKRKAVGRVRAVVQKVDGNFKISEDYNLSPEVRSWIFDWDETVNTNHTITPCPPARLTWTPHDHMGV